MVPFNPRIPGRSDFQVMSWELPPSHQGQRTSPPPTRNRRGECGLPLPNLGASGDSDHCISPGHFLSALHAAISSSACFPSLDLLAFHEHPHFLPLEAHSHVPGPAHPEMVASPISRTADISSLNSLFWLPSDRTISHYPSVCLHYPPCTCHLRSLFTIWLPKGREYRLLTGAFPQSLGSCWRGLARAQRKGHTGCARPLCIFLLLY